jgi:hypothetical protein
LPMLPGTTTQSILRSFDISFVDGNSHYALASSALSATGTGPACSLGSSPSIPRPTSSTCWRWGNSPALFNSSGPRHLSGPDGLIFFKAPNRRSGGRWPDFQHELHPQAAVRPAGSVKVLDCG